jgi:hypothetical protein
METECRSFHAPDVDTLTPRGQIERNVSSPWPTEDGIDVIYETLRFVFTGVFIVKRTKE